MALPPVSKIEFDTLFDYFKINFEKPAATMVFTSCQVGLVREVTLCYKFNVDIFQRRNIIKTFLDFFLSSYHERCYTYYKFYLNKFINK